MPGHQCPYCRGILNSAWDLAEHIRARHAIPEDPED